MWILLARDPKPDAPYWLGRRWLALLDAVLWPALVCGAVARTPIPTGVVGPLLAAVTIFAALHRARQALWANHRYRFTTWRVGQLMVGLLLIGFTMKPLSH